MKLRDYNGGGIRVQLRLTCQTEWISLCFGTLHVYSMQSKEVSRWKKITMIGYRFENVQGRIAPLRSICLNVPLVRGLGVPSLRMNTAQGNHVGIFNIYNYASVVTRNQKLLLFQVTDIRSRFTFIVLSSTPPRATQQSSEQH